MNLIESNQLPLPVQRRIKAPRAKRKSPSQKKVAAYIGFCSDKKTRQEQRLFFTSKIKANPFWDLLGIYEEPDCFEEQGTALAALMNDCQQKQVDLILIKDITTLSHRASEVSQIIEHLSKHQIPLHFEREGIDTLTSGGKFLLSLLSNIETDWDDKVDENVTVAIQELFFEGEYHHQALYGYRWKNNRFEADPKEAESIILMFQLFAEGKTLREISSKLATKGLYNRNTKPFSEHYIYSAFNQEKYRGFTFVHKDSFRCALQSITEDMVDSPLILKGTHPKLIDDNLYRMFLKEQERRRSTEIIRWRAYSCFTRRIRCGICGEVYVLEASNKHNRTPFNQGSYQCKAKSKAKRNNKPTQCSNKNLPVYTLKKICTRVLAPLAKEECSTSFKESWVETLVDKIVVFEGSVEFHLASGQIITEPWKNTASDDYWTLVRKLSNEYFKQEKNSVNAIDEKQTGLNDRKEVCLG